MRIKTINIRTTTTYKHTHTFLCMYLNQQQPNLHRPQHRLQSETCILAKYILLFKTRDYILHWQES